MICIKIHQPRRAAALSVREVEYGKFESLHPDVKDITVDWLRGAIWALEHDDGPFKAFMDLWIGLNSWYACTVDAEKESTQITALSCDPYLNELFTTFVTYDEYSPRVEDFVRFWPIFDVKALRRRPELLHRTYQDREARVRDYIDSGVERFQPRCWRGHAEENADCQVDWQHALRTIYQIRCNLMHGSKSQIFEDDYNIVRSAGRVLGPIVETMMREKYDITLAEHPGRR